MGTRKVLGIIFSILFIGAFAFVLSWGIINFNKVQDGLSGTGVYTKEDIDNAYKDGYSTALDNEKEYTELIDSYRDTITTQTDEISKLNSQITTLTNNNKDYSTQISNLTTQRNNLQNEVDNLSEVKTQNELLIDDLNLQIEVLEKQVSDLKNNNVNKDNEIAQKNTQIANLQNTVTQLQKTNDLNSQTIANLNSQIVSLNSQISDMTLQIQNNSANVTALNNKIAELEKSVAYYEQYVASLENGEQVVATFEFNGSVYSIQVVNKNDKVSVVNPTSTEYVIFNYWTVDGEQIDLSTYQITTNTKIVANVTYKYDVKYLVDDIEYNSQIVLKNGYATIPTNPTKSGYEFDGWTLNGVDIVDPSTMAITQNVTYIAKFTKLHTVSFIYEDTTYSTQTIRNGNYANNVSIDTTTYKVFNGWTLNGAIVDVTAQKIVSDTTFVASITYKYDVKFMVDNAEHSSQIIIDNGYPIMPTDPTKTGYHFVGWSINGTDIINPTTIVINHNTTFIAVFSQPLVTFVANDITFATMNVAVNSFATLSDIPTKSGYAFDGWTLNGVDLVDISSYAINEDTTFIAKFSKLHNVTFVYEDTTYSTQTVKNNTSPTSVSVSSTDYKVFNGWTLNGNIVDITTCKITSDTTFVASITYRHKVNFVANNNIIGSYFVNHNGYLDFDTLYNLHIDLEQYDSNNGKFIGWSTNSNVHNTAIYEANYVEPNSLQEYAITNDISFYAVYEYSIDEDYSYRFEAEVLNTDTNTTYTLSFDIVCGTTGLWKSDNESNTVSDTGSSSMSGSITNSVLLGFEEGSITNTDNQFEIIVKVTSSVCSSSSQRTIKFVFDLELLSSGCWVINLEDTADENSGRTMSVISATITRNS